MSISVGGDKLVLVRYHPTVANVLAVASNDLSVSIWDMATRERKLQLVGHEQPVSVHYFLMVADLSYLRVQLLSMAWSADGTRLTTLSRDARLRVFRPLDGAQSVMVSASSWCNPRSIMGFHLCCSGSNCARKYKGWPGIVRVSRSRHFSHSFQPVRTFYCHFSHLYCPIAIFRTSMRQISMFDSRTLEKIHSMPLDTSPSLLVPYFDYDSNVLTLTGKARTVNHRHRMMQLSNRSCCVAG